MRRFSGPSRGRRVARGDVRQRASSLIELLVVISVIALLLGMLLPSLKRSVRLANDTICKRNLREVGLILRMYRVDNDGWLPIIEPPPVSSTASGGSPDVWFLKLYPTYFQDPTLLTCPEDPFRRRMAELDDLDSYNDQSWNGEQLQRARAIADYPSFGLNSFIMTGGRGQLANVERYEPSRPGDTILLADLGPDQMETRSTGQNAQRVGPERNTGLLGWGDDFDVIMGPTDSWLTTRHNECINILTLSGGVRRGRTLETLRRPIDIYYEDCARGGCTLCRELALTHYTFARDRLFWWTGTLPDLRSSRNGF